MDIEYAAKRLRLWKDSRNIYSSAGYHNPFLNENMDDTVRGEGGSTLHLGRWFGYIASEHGDIIPFPNMHYENIQPETVIGMLRGIHVARPMHDSSSFLALATILVNRMGEGFTNEVFVNALPFSYSYTKMRSTRSVGIHIPSTFDGVAVVQLMPRETRCCAPLVYLRGVLDIIHARVPSLRQKTEKLCSFLVDSLGVNECPDKVMMKSYQFEKDRIFKNPYLRQMLEWCKLGKLILDDCTYLKRLENAGPANETLMMQIEWLVALPWVWESYVLLRLRDYFRSHSLGEIVFDVEKPPKMKQYCSSIRLCQPDIVVWAEFRGERRPAAVLDAKLYRSASQRGNDMHGHQLGHYIFCLQNMHNATTWWSGRVAFGIVYGYWQDGPEGAPTTDNDCHIDLRGGGAVSCINAALERFAAQTMCEIGKRMIESGS